MFLNFKKVLADQRKHVALQLENIHNKVKNVLIFGFNFCLLTQYCLIVRQCEVSTIYMISDCNQRVKSVHGNINLRHSGHSVIFLEFVVTNKWKMKRHTYTIRLKCCFWWNFVFVPCKAAIFRQSLYFLSRRFHRKWNPANSVE